MENALSHDCILTTNRVFTSDGLELFCSANIYSFSQNKLLEVKEVKAKQNADQTYGVLGWVHVSFWKQAARAPPLTNEFK